MSYVQTRHYSLPEGQGAPDGVLVEQALAGNQCAFDILVRRYHRLLVSYIHGFISAVFICRGRISKASLKGVCEHTETRESVQRGGSIRENKRYSKNRKLPK